MTTTSIITSMYNSKEKTIETIDKLFLPSILNNAASDKELIILDDQSPMKKQTEQLMDKYMPDLKKQFGNVTFSKNSENLGFGRSYNKGIWMAAGESLLIANDDIYLPSGSVDALTRTLSENPEYGIVGPITNEKGTFTYQYCKQAPRIKNYSQEEFQKIEDFAGKARELMSGRRIETDLISGFCMAVPSSILKELGAFDEEFKYGLWEDTDLVKRISQKYKVIINPEVYVDHGGVNGASGSILQHPLKALKAGIANQYKYGKKWNDHRGTFKHFARGIRRLSGKDTVSELFE